MLVHFLPDCLDSLAAEFCPSASPCDDDIWADWVIESIVLQIQSNCTTAAKWLSAGFKIGVLLSFEGVYTSSLFSNFPQECCAVPRLDKMLAHCETSNDGGKRGVLRGRRGKNMSGCDAFTVFAEACTSELQPNKQNCAVLLFMRWIKSNHSPKTQIRHIPSL